MGPEIDGKPGRSPAVLRHRRVLSHPPGQQAAAEGTGRQGEGRGAAGREIGAAPWGYMAPSCLACMVTPHRLTSNDVTPTTSYLQIWTCAFLGAFLAAHVGHTAQICSFLRPALSPGRQLAPRCLQQDVLLDAGLAQGNWGEDCHKGALFADCYSILLCSSLALLIAFCCIVARL